MKRPTRNSHYGSVNNPKSFDEAYSAVLGNPNKAYRTEGGKAFRAEARITSKGVHKGEKVLVFKQDEKEMARSYRCCWGKTTNCNRTYIDPYTPKI